MQVNMDRPRGLAKLLNGLVNQNAQENDQLLGILREKQKKEQLQNLSSTYLRQFSDANGDVMKMINANSGLASGLFGMGDFESGMKVVTSNNTLASKLYERNNPKARPLKSRERFEIKPTADGKGQEKIEFSDYYDEMNPAIVVNTVEKGRTPYESPDAKDRNTDLKYSEKEKEEAQKLITELTDRNIESGKKMKSLDAKYQFTYDGNGNVTGAKYIDPATNKMIDATEDPGALFITYSEQKKALQDDIGVNEKRIEEQSKITGGTFRRGSKSGGAEQPTKTTGASPTQASTKPLNTRNDGKVKVKLSDGRQGFIDPKEFNSSTMTYMK